MDRVYGAWHGEKVKWRPKPYADNKSRYLWTDAFGVCNYISLARETGLVHFLDQAEALINDVHETLGRDRSGKRLPNATDAEPLKGGLRIGKQQEEGHPDGDGQYFHYLTKWAFALNCMCVARKDKRYNALAVQLLKSVHPHFLFSTLSDLQRPLVASEGNLDPMDGYVTYRLVQAEAGGNVLEREIVEIFELVKRRWERYESNDPLDLGEALWLTHWYADEAWAMHVASTSGQALDALWKAGFFALPLRRRLAFREMGTALGMLSSPITRSSDKWRQRAEAIIRDWEGRIFERDEDISPVMYCTALLPGVWQRQTFEAMQA